MPKVAVVTDTNSGIFPDRARSLGMYSIPMPFTINGEEFFEGVNLTHDEYYAKMEGGADISTSQPSPAAVLELWDELLKTHDQIVHIPMSSSLSSSVQTAVMLADDYDGKVQVVDNQRISVTQARSAMDAVELAGKGFDAPQIKEILVRDKKESSIYITLNTLYYLKKGGRITPAAAAIGTILRIKPVLTIQGGKLDAFSKARTLSQAKTTMLNALASDIEKRFNNDKTNIHFYIAYTKNEEAARELAGEMAEKFDVKNEVICDQLSLSIASHVGPGSLGVAISMVPPELR